jgi:hypothetical protein
MAGRRSEAVVVIDDGMLIAGGQRIADLAMTRRLPAIGNRELVEAGGPADLSIEPAERLELIVNLKTAKALGLRADHFIQ